MSELCELSIDIDIWDKKKEIKGGSLTNNKIKEYIYFTNYEPDRFQLPSSLKRKEFFATFIEIFTSNCFSILST